MAVVNVIIDGDGVAFSETLRRMQPGDRILLTAYREYTSLAGEYLAVSSDGKCHGCVLEDVIDLECGVYCGECIITKKEDILEEL